MTDDIVTLRESVLISLAQPNGLATGKWIFCCYVDDAKALGKWFDENLEGRFHWPQRTNIEHLSERDVQSHRVSITLDDDNAAMMLRLAINI